MADTAVDQAAKLGTEHGHAAATWVFDGSTSRETYLAYRKGLDDGDPEILDALPRADLSGQWADSYSARDLLSDVGADEDGDDDVFAAYEDAYNEAVQAEVYRVLNVQLGETP